MKLTLKSAVQDALSNSGFEGFEASQKQVNRLTQFAEQKLSFEEYKQQILQDRPNLARSD